MFNATKSNKHIYIYNILKCCDSFQFRIIFSFGNLISEKWPQFLNQNSVIGNSCPSGFARLPHPSHFAWYKSITSFILTVCFHPTCPNQLNWHSNAFSCLYILDAVSREHWVCFSTLSILLSGSFLHTYLGLNIVELGQWLLFYVLSLHNIVLCSLFVGLKWVNIQLVYVTWP